MAVKHPAATLGPWSLVLGPSSALCRPPSALLWRLLPESQLQGVAYLLRKPLIRPQVANHRQAAGSRKATEILLTSFLDPFRILLGSFLDLPTGRDAGDRRCRAAGSPAESARSSRPATSSASLVPDPWSLVPAPLPAAFSQRPSPPSPFSFLPSPIPVVRRPSSALRRPASVFLRQFPFPSASHLR